MVRAWDVRFGDPDDVTYLGLTLYEDRQTPKSVRSTFLPAASTGSPLEDVTVSDWSNGMGYSQPGLVRNGYAYGLGVDTRSPGLVMPSGEVAEMAINSVITDDVSIVGSFVYDDVLYLVSTRYVFREIGTEWVIYNDQNVETFDGSAVVCDYAGSRVVFLGHAGGSKLTKFDGSTFTTVMNHGYHSLAAVYWTTTDGVSVRRLVGATNTRTIKHCPLTSDPMSSASWSAAITVGEGEHDIKGMVSAGRHVYVLTNGGVYDLNELGETLALTPYQAELKEPYNGNRSRFYDKYVMFNHAVGVDAVDVSDSQKRHVSPSWVTPGAEGGTPNETPVWGGMTASAIDGGWFVMAISDNRDGYVLYGKPREKVGVQGTSPWVWHGAFAKFSGETITHMRVRSTTTNGARARYLYIATAPYDGDGDPKIYRQSLPRSSSPKQEYDAIVAGTQTVPHRFGSSFTLVGSPIDWGEPTRNKIGLRLDLGTENLDTGNAVSAYVDADGTAATAPVGAATVSPLQSLTMVSDAPSGLQLTPRLVATGGPRNPPILRSLTFRAAIDREQIEVLEFDAWFVKGAAQNNGGHDVQMSDDVKWRLMAGLQNTVQEFQDPLDREYTVLVEPGITSVIKEIESPAYGERGWGRKATVRLRVLDSGARYDTSELYDFLARYS